MSKANFIDFTVMYWTGSAWSDTYNSIQFRNISNNNNYPSLTSKLDRKARVGAAKHNEVGGKLVELDSGGFWYEYMFHLVARNANGHSVLEGLLNKTQSKHADHPYFRIYPDIVNNATDYDEVSYTNFSEEYHVENTVRGGIFTFKSITKATTWSGL